MLTIFSNQSATFNHPDDYNTKCSVSAFDFVSVPDWVPDSEMFKALKSMGKIKIIENSKDVADIEIKGKVDDKKVEKALEDVSKVVVAGANLDADASADENICADNVPPADDEADDDDADVDEAEAEEAEAEETETADYESMTNKELYKLCVEKGINIEAKMPKKAYIDALNSNK